MSSAKFILATHLDITGDDAESWSNICKVFWTKYYLLFGLIFVLILGSTVPTIGNKDGPLATSITSSWIAVSMIFFVTGLSVKTAEIKKATLFWQLNLFIHFFIYIYHPLIGVALTNTLKAITSLSPYLLDGLLITLCLPTTISSAVVLTVNSNGNEAAAVVNTTTANILGIILTPALIFIFLGNLGSVNIGTVFFKLSLRVITPFVLGQIIRYIGGEKTRTYIDKIRIIILKKISETLLLYIIFCAISESFYVGLDAGYMDIIIMSIIIFCLHIITLIIVWYLSGIRGYNEEIDNIEEEEEEEERSCCQCCDECMRFNIYDRLAILFCSSQKTAAFGIPIISSLYETNEYLGIYVIPLLIYHPLELIIDSFLVQPLSNKVSRYEKQRDIEIIDMNQTQEIELQSDHKRLTADDGGEMKRRK